MFLRKSVLEICSKFTGEYPCRSAISVKLQRNFIEIALRNGYSPVNLLHIFRTPFPNNTSGWQLLAWISFLIKLLAWVLLKMRLWHRCFSVTFARFLIAPFLKNTSGCCFWTLNEYSINYSALFWFAGWVCACIIQMLVMRSLVDSKFVKKNKLEETLEKKESQHDWISLNLLFCYYISTILLISNYLET